ncbi:MAG TPA: CopG family transcriptional regulator [Thermoanaerobaculia bacterium]|nr:CopG family transcriptional regulator [Thermoanaerobaculia bacterium]
MKKTTLYLPDELKEKVEAVAKEDGRSEAQVIRDALATAVEARRPPKPRLPLPGIILGDPTVAERAGELLEGFGE